jgi:hypothetical protein
MDDLIDLYMRVFARILIREDTKASPSPAVPHFHQQAGPSCSSFEQRGTSAVRANQLSTLASKTHN